MAGIAIHGFGRIGRSTLYRRMETYTRLGLQM